MVAQLMTSYLNEGASAELERLYGSDWKRIVVEMASMIQSELTRPKNQSEIPLQLTLFNMGDTEFDAQKHCAKNICSVGAILESRQVLLKSTYTDPEKRKALAYLMHFSVQIHIPLNCGLVRDSGGQKIYLKDELLQPVNFAWIWNYDLYRRMNVRWFSYANKLSRKLEDENTEEWLVSLNPQDWAMESHSIAMAQVYPMAVEGRYSANLINKGQKLLEEQLMKAALRTAALLNSLFEDA